MKTRKRPLSKIAHIALACAVAFMSAVAFLPATKTLAANPTTPAGYTDLATISVHKTITASESGAYPVGPFNFTVTPSSYTPGPSANPYPDPATIPQLTGSPSIQVTGFQPDYSGTTQTKTATSAPIQYKYAGTYVYKLTEDSSTIPGVTSDPTVYYVKVDVNNLLNADGTPVLDADGNPVVYVGDISQWKGATDPTSQGSTSTKVGLVTPPSDGSGYSTTPVDAGYDFNNNYSTADLTVSKTVTGNLADPKQSFGFVLSLNAAVAGNPADTASYSYQIYNEGADNQIGGTDDTPVGSAGTITNGGTFSLTHHQYIKILGLPAGEKIQTVEQGAADYTTTISDKHGTGTVTPTAINGKDTGVQTISTGTNAVNEEDFTNNKQAPVPTGIIMTVLPFAGMFALAALGLFLFLKKRKSGRLFNAQ